MKAVLQRVSQAAVTVDNKTIGTIGKGLLVLVAFEKDDRSEIIDRMINKILHYRIFEDNHGKMNLSVQAVNGGILWVPQFTLAANTKKGLRPNFSPSAPPEESRVWFDYLVMHAKTLYKDIQYGSFGAYMRVKLCNDGPVTIILSET